MSYEPLVYLLDSLPGPNETGYVLYLPQSGKIIASQDVMHVPTPIRNHQL
jgi:hypothetical protein